LRALALLLLPSLLLGCMELRLRLRLFDGGAGQFVMEFRVDLESMVRQGAQLAVSMGEEPKSEEELQQLVEEMRADLTSGGMQPKLDTSDLPEGMEVADVTTGMDDDLDVVRIVLGFDSLDSLRQPVNPQTAANLGVPVGEGGSLLGGLEVTEKGKVVLVSGDPIGEPGTEAVSPEDLEMMRPLLEGLVIVYEIEAPDWKIKANNAHERESKVLRWRWDLDALAGDREIKAKFRR